MDNRESFILIIGAVIVVLAQIIIAPYIVVFSAMPNFILVFVLIISVLRSADSTMVVAFVLGLLFDLFGYGPIGAMAFLITLAAFVITRIFSVLDRSNIVMVVLVCVVAVLAIELIYSFILFFLGIAPVLGDALIYRALPSILLDCIVGLIFFPLLAKVISPSLVGESQGIGAGTSLKDSAQFKKPKRSIRKSKRYR